MPGSKLTRDAKALTSVNRLEICNAGKNWGGGFSNDDWNGVLGGSGDGEVKGMMYY